MKTQDFYFDLPDALIAQYPLVNRHDSRLLTYSRCSRMIEHHAFSSIPDLLRAGDLLVMNDSQVIPARLYGHKATGGAVEVLVERIVGTDQFFAHIKASKALKAGAVIYLEQGFQFQILEKKDDLYCCHLDGDVDHVLHTIGHIPLPPYIHRSDEQMDLARYQTVYAKHKGSVAAPTAGLHFDASILAALQAKGVNVGFVTLHVGAGTFQPVRTARILDHKMHAEQFWVSDVLCEQVMQTQAAGNRVIAVGTTALRSLESAARTGVLTPQSGETDIFIYPGYSFKVCDGLITNFHLPESTLLMLVSALIGQNEAMHLYQTAIQAGYRFFSYGDTSLLL